MFHRAKLFIALFCLSAVLISAEIPRRAEPTSRINRQSVGRVRPFDVQLRNASGAIVCAGTLVGPQHVLTAAQCFDNNKPSELKVLLNAEDSEDRGFANTIEKLFIHESYNSANFHNDVAVLKLSREYPLPQDIGIPQICSKPLEEIGTFRYVSSWHRTMAKQVFYVSLGFDPMYQDECIEDVKEEGFDVEITSSMICNDPHDNYPCQVVAGGAALSKEKEICGIVVGGSACDNPDFPGIYTDVYKVRDFIKASLNA